MDKKWASQFFADPKGLGYYMSETEHNTVVEFMGLGKVHVYREYRPTKDSIEYTIYFKHEGSNHRLDMEAFFPELEGRSTEWVNGYVEGWAVGAAPEQIDWDEQMRKGLLTPNEVREKHSD